MRHYLDRLQESMKAKWNTPALSDYRETVKRLDEAVAQYESKYGPLTAASGAMGERWSWVTGPWPWHYEFGEGK